jgi:hypothetical protein
MMKYISQYIKPRSVTWWPSFASLMAGLFVATGPIHGLTAWVDTINNLTGNAAPYALISAGFVGIGIRKAIG